MDTHDWQPGGSPIIEGCVRCPYPEKHRVHGWAPPEDSPYTRVGGADPFPGWRRTMTDEGKKITLTVTEVALTADHIQVRGIQVYRSEDNDKVLQQQPYDKSLELFKETWL